LPGIPGEGCCRFGFPAVRADETGVPEPPAFGGLGMGKPARPDPGAKIYLHY